MWGILSVIMYIFSSKRVHTNCYAVDINCTESLYVPEDWEDVPSEEQSALECVFHQKRGLVQSVRKLLLSLALNGITRRLVIASSQLSLGIAAIAPVNKTGRKWLPNLQRSQDQAQMVKSGSVKRQTKNFIIRSGLRRVCRAMLCQERGELILSSWDTQWKMASFLTLFSHIVRDVYVSDE